MIESLEEFIDYYNTNSRLPLPLSTPKLKLNEFQLKSKYNDYIRRLESKNKKLDFSEITYTKNPIEEAMDSFRNKNDRSPFINWFNKLNQSQKKIIKDKLWMCPSKNTENGLELTFDVAHIVSRSDSKYLADKEVNYILLPRYVHHCLDNYLDPFTYNSMSEDQCNNYWIELIGKERWGWLQNNKRVKLI